MRRCWLVSYSLYFRWNQAKTGQEQKNLDSAWVHHDSDSLSHGLRRKISGKLCSNWSSISMCSGDLSPDNPHLGLGVTVWNTGLVLGLVHVGTSLANVPSGLLLLCTSFNLKKSSMFMLISLTSLVSSEDSLRVQTSWHHLERLVTSEINSSYEGKNFDKFKKLLISYI